jgi:acetylornithine deacetylase
VALSPEEDRIRAAIEERRDELVQLTTELVGFDTTARHPADPPREEAALQEHLAARLRAAGAEVELWEPDPSVLEGNRQVPGGLTFEGRPQLVARFAGSGGGRSLLLNGHIDAVPADPVERWTSAPFTATVRDGRLYGRGTCDMKGGVAAMVLAAETLAQLGVPLRGDVIVNTVTDEESSGAGGIASVAHGVRADAGIVPEPTSFDVWVACRGTVYPTVVFEGRPAHAELAQPSWRDGGGVNAIEKAGLVLAAVGALREEWRRHPAHRHPHLSPPDLIPTRIDGGEWPVTYPAECRIGFDIPYLPVQADERGWGTLVEAEVETWVARIAATDPWLAEHPPRLEWETDVPPAEVPDDHPIVEATMGATADVGRPGRLAGLDSWHDGATFTLAGTPSVCFGPYGLENGHTVDEHVPVDDLVQCAAAIAIAAARFCA